MTKEILAEIKEGFKLTKEEVKESIKFFILGLLTPLCFGSFVLGFRGCVGMSLFFGLFYLFIGGFVKLMSILENK